eukprot:TRINITY_DN25336_c0_g1_i1.p1 TRINITY_DN25336_c0_g1~~TRINITY_DN25336_c0_g1_i1.p1  ORF type:complete len:113 (+),score=14.75 TRINITY_DN25336_c0_g1_i1:3-341(+)
MHNDAIDIKHHDGIEEEDVSGSVPQSWAKFSKNNVEESQAGRSSTRQLRYDVNNLINNAASDMSVHWNKTTEHSLTGFQRLKTHIGTSNQISFSPKMKLLIWNVTLNGSKKQ